jgi:transcription antitermination factor NusG
LEVGNRVRITTGPMTGMEGILERQKNELRVVLQLEMIGRSVSVEVGAEEVEFVGPTPDHTRSTAPKTF